MNLEPDAAFDRAGNLEVAWRATLAGRTFIPLQRFDPQGRPVGGAAPVNKVIAGPRSWPRLALDPWSGDALVTWVDARQTGNPDVCARHLDAAGAPRALELDVALDLNGEAQSAQPLAHLTADTFGARSDVSDVSDASDAGYTLTVTDTQTRNQKIYRKSGGTLASRADNEAF